MAYVPNSGSVVAFQSDPTKLLVTASVSGIAGASIIGLPPFVLGGSTNASIITVGTAAANQSVSGIVGASIVGQLPAGTAPLGSVATLQGTNPWIVTSSIAGGIFPVSGSVAAVIVGTPNVNTAGSVVSFPGAGWAGSVVAFQAGIQTTSIVSTVPSSVMVGASIFGQLPAGTAVLGSVIAYQGVSPWLETFSNSSIIAINAGSVVTLSSGSVITVQQANSIVGTYLEDAGHTTADRGIFTLMVRNDTVSSITSNDTDYSPHVVDAVGRTIIKPFAGEEATIISYTGSVVSASVTLIQASAIGKKSYMTDFWAVNTGSVAQLLTFQDGSTSVLGFTIVPAGGGSNSPGINIPIKTANAQDLAYKITGTSSTIYLTVKGYQAQ